MKIMELLIEEFADYAVLLNKKYIQEYYTEYTNITYENKKGEYSLEEINLMIKDIMQNSYTKEVLLNIIKEGSIQNGRLKGDNRLILVPIYNYLFNNCNEEELKVVCKNFEKYYFNTSETTYEGQKIINVKDITITEKAVTTVRKGYKLHKGLPKENEKDLVDICELIDNLLIDKDLVLTIEDKKRIEYYASKKYGSIIEDKLRKAYKYTKLTSVEALNDPTIKNMYKVLLNEDISNIKNPYYEIERIKNEHSDSLDDTKKAYFINSLYGIDYELDESKIEFTINDIKTYLAMFEKEGHEITPDLVENAIQNLIVKRMNMGNFTRNLKYEYNKYMEDNFIATMNGFINYYKNDKMDSDIKRNMEKLNRFGTSSENVVVDYQLLKYSMRYDHQRTTHALNLYSDALKDIKSLKNYYKEISIEEQYEMNKDRENTNELKVFENNYKNLLEKYAQLSEKEAYFQMCYDKDILDVDKFSKLLNIYIKENNIKRKETDITARSFAKKALEKYRDELKQGDKLISPAIKDKYYFLREKLRVGLVIKKRDVRNYYDSYCESFFKQSGTSIIENCYKALITGENTYEYIFTNYGFEQVESIEELFKYAEINFPELNNKVSAIKEKIYIDKELFKPEKSEAKTIYEKGMNEVYIEKNSNLQKLVLEFVDSKCKSMKEFCTMKIIEQKEFDKAVDFVKDTNEDLYQLYIEKVSGQTSKRYVALVENSKLIINSIANGYKSKDGSVREFTYLDYKLTTALDFDKFLEFAQNNISIDVNDYRKLRQFIAKNYKAKFITEESVMKEKWIVGASGEQHEVTPEEKHATLSFLKRHNIKLDIKVYKLAYKNRNLYDDFYEDQDTK